MADSFKNVNCVSLNPNLHFCVGRLRFGEVQVRYGVGYGIGSTQKYKLGLTHN